MGHVPNAAEVAFVQKAYASSAAFMTVCGGITYALAAGLLAGRVATGPRFLLPLLRGLSPTTRWVEQRWARDGKLWTSGALCNGLDMMRAFMQDTWGPGGGIGDFLCAVGSAPNRDLDYKDEKKVTNGFELLPGTGGEAEAAGA